VHPRLAIAHLVHIDPTLAPRVPVRAPRLTPRTDNLNVAPTKPWSPCKPHTVRQPRNQAAARACRSSS
jgi:hypothetical protein